VTHRRRDVLYHTIDGAGNPLLLLNGIAMTAASWQPIAEPLAGHYRVIRCDLRGQLMSPGPPPMEVADHVDDVLALLDHLEIDRVHLVATSFGAVIAALVAARRPERVRSLVSIASADAFDDGMAVEVERWRNGCLRSLAGPDRGVIGDVLEATVYSPGYLASHPEQRAERRRMIAALPDAWFEGLAGLLESAPSVALGSELAAIRCPTLVVAAELDRFIPFDRTKVLAERIPGARFRVIEAAGHAVVVEQPETIVDLCLEFFREVNDT
jgi:3-oxoadipate enol-lactonase/3-oxoadipate enol-lactonase/4-carboxymuconolactone decarboxylase